LTGFRRGSSEGPTALPKGEERGDDYMPVPGTLHYVIVNSESGTVGKKKGEERGGSLILAASVENSPAGKSIDWRFPGRRPGGKSDSNNKEKREDVGPPWEGEEEKS